MSEDKKLPYVEYTVRITRRADEFLDTIVDKENQKRKNPKEWLNKEAFMNMLVRDWFFQASAPLVQQKATQDYGAQITKEFSEIYK